MSVVSELVQSRAILIANYLEASGFPVTWVKGPSEKDPKFRFWGCSYLAGPSWEEAKFGIADQAIRDAPDSVQLFIRGNYLFYTFVIELEYAE